MAGHGLRLADGRLIRLGGLHVPRESEAATQEYLARILAGRALRYVAGEPAEDRYGRIIADVVVTERGRDMWLQLALVERGLALATLAPGESACAGTLIAAEGVARRLRAGAWSAGHGPVLMSDDRAGLERHRGKFALVQGRIVSVSARERTVYLNFGQNWKESFTAMILKRDRGTIEGHGLDFAKLDGKMVRVRGYVDGRDTARMVVERPEAIEILDGE